jgi:twinfilin
MSHSSGIPVSPALAEEFRAAQGDAALRLIKVEIAGAEMVSVATEQVKGSWEEDIELVSPLCEKDTPCYILFKKETDAGGIAWVMFTYVPDTAKVKPKMLYASTRAPLKIQLGQSQFTDDVFGTVPEDFTRAGFEHYLESKTAEAPLTDAEFTKQQEQESGEIHMGSGSTYVHGVAFPVNEDVIAAVKNLGSQNYVQIAIDTEKEVITLDHAGTLGSMDDLKAKIHTSEPRFHFFAWTHEYKGDQVTSNVFVFSCPDGSGDTKSAPVKQRMLYSSSKANVSSILESNGGKVDGKVECNSAEELSEDNVRQSVHPPETEEKKSFAKPKRAGRAGGRRLIRDRK